MDLFFDWTRGVVSHGDTKTRKKRRSSLIVGMLRSTMKRLALVKAANNIVEMVEKNNYPR